MLWHSFDIFLLVILQKAVIDRQHHRTSGYVTFLLRVDVEIWTRIICIHNVHLGKDMF